MSTQTEEVQPGGRAFKILAIDGGGFKGLYSASLLCELESTHGRIIDHFNMLCGTSTGALIALSLSVGKSAQEVVGFYKEWGPRIFPRGGVFGKAQRVLRFWTTKSRYRADALRRGARAILGNARMGDAQCYLCIPSFDITSSSPRVFKTRHCDGLTRDDDILMSEVALATSAAPTYFPIATCAERQTEFHYIDGGIWANNPALVGLTEAVHYFVGPGKPYDSLQVLAVGNVSPPPGRLASNQYSSSPLDFAAELLEAVGHAQQKSVDYFTGFLAGSFNFPVRYVRIPPLPLSDRQSNGISLDMATPQSIETLLNLGSRQGHEWKSQPQVAELFRERVRSASESEVRNG